MPISAGTSTTLLDDSIDESGTAIPEDALVDGVGTVEGPVLGRVGNGRVRDSEKPGVLMTPGVGGTGTLR